ncbi:DUF1294 domain-containing protein [Rhizobium sp.]|jgi:uncharacterized membrane protein YsdA (DUF1294 family)|uniref:DUF1294 domain-containing protein n=1 Tax=Rhizobium sp. TaxID=391 RepID=UPI000DB91CCB
MLLTDLAKIIGLFTAWNGLVFTIYFIDKQAARYGQWRISEKTLLTLAFLAGSPGAVSAQQLLRHKTRKEPFRSELMAICGFHLLAVVALIAAIAARMLGLI